MQFFSFPNALNAVRHDLAALKEEEIKSRAVNQELLAEQKKTNEFLERIAQATNPEQAVSGKFKVGPVTEQP